MSHRPLHVVLMIQSLGIGGAEYSLVNLINESDPALVRFSLVVFSSHVPLMAMVRRTDVTLCTVHKHGKVSRHLVDDLVAVLKDLQPDIVHTHLFTADIWGTLAANKLGIPCISTEHNINREYGLVRTGVKWWFRNRSSTYVACSDAVRQYMQQTYHITKPIEVIPNGVAVQQFAALLEPGFVKPLRLAIVGRLVEQKGHRVLFEALATLQQFSWELVVVGDGELLLFLERLAGEFGLVDRVRFVGATTTVSDIMASVDVVVVPSLWEGLGVVAREAMAAGRLVVASATGGLREFIVSGQTGVLVTPGDSRALARALTDVFEHPEDFVKMSQQARVYAREHFSLATMVERYMKVYQRLIS